MDEELRFRVTEEMKDAVAEAAKGQGLCPSAYLRQMVHHRLRAGEVNVMTGAAA